MKYAIDKIEDNLVTLENIETNEIETVSKEILPENIKEGSILIKKVIYEIDSNEEQKRRKRINRLFDKLKK